MSPIRGLNESEFGSVVRYSRGSDETVSEAVVDAFLAADIDVFDKTTVLDDWVNTDLLEDSRWATDRIRSLCVLIWDRPVVITPEEVRIYDVTKRELQLGESPHR